MNTKRIFLLLLSLALAFNIHAQSGLTWHNDFDKAYNIANTTNKPLLLFFTGSDWCGWCKKIQKEVFVDKKFEEWAKKNVVLVEVDFPRAIKQSDALKKQNANLQAQLGVQGYPTIFFVKANKKSGANAPSVLGSMYYQPGGAAAFIKSADVLIKK